MRDKASNLKWKQQTNEERQYSTLLNQKSKANCFCSAHKTHSRRLFSSTSSENRVKRKERQRQNISNMQNSTKNSVIFAIPNSTTDSRAPCVRQCSPCVAITVKCCRQTIASIQRFGIQPGRLKQFTEHSLCELGLGLREINCERKRWKH